jgi:NDP-sugar pyrophosphorylase family protein
MKAIILPVGKPDLLNPLTTWLPEFLLPVVNKPIVEHLIELLVRHNIRDIILILKHMPYETEQYLGSGQNVFQEILSPTLTFQILSRPMKESVGILLFQNRQKRIMLSFLCPWTKLRNSESSIHSS